MKDSALSLTIEHHRAREPHIILTIAGANGLLIIMSLNGLNIDTGFWGALSGCLVLFLVWWMLRLPLCTVFNPQEHTIEQIYRVNFLAPKSRIFRFSEWAFVRTYLRIEDENFPVSLELRSHSRKTLLITSRPPQFDPNEESSLWPQRQYVEPKDLCQLREKIASLIGATDLGFQRPN